jgi:signal transduction histidine kinase
MNAPDNPAVMQACAGIKAATSRATAKLQDMLMAANPKPPKMELASLRTLLVMFEGSSTNEARAARVDFHLHYPDGDHLLLADVDQIRQLLTNLFGNSLDAIKQARELQPALSSGTILVGVTTLRRSDGVRDEEVILLSWADDGHGMSEEVAANAFTPLYTTKETGSGLGLFIAKTIVEAHGGRIEIQTACESGVQFDIELPLVRFIKHPQAMPQADEALAGEPNL